MKVILVNGSPHTDGCTFRGLKEVGDTLIKEGIEVNLLGLVFGVDVLRPALKLPFFGRIGMKDA